MMAFHGAIYPAGTRRRRCRRAMVVVVVVAALLAGCGGGRRVPTPAGPSPPGADLKPKAYDTGWLIQAVPLADSTVLGDTAFIAVAATGDQYRLAALSLPSGQPRWQVLLTSAAGPATTEIPIGPASFQSSSGEVVVDSEFVNGTWEIVARHGGSGAVAWAKPLSSRTAALSGSACADRYCFSTESQDQATGTLQAVSPATGATLWSVATNPGTCRIVDTNGNTVVTAPDTREGALIAYDARTGQKRWSANPPPSRDLDLNPGAGVLGSWYQDGGALVGDLPGPLTATGPGALEAVNLRNGALLWYRSGDHLAGPLTQAAAGHDLLASSLIVTTSDPPHVQLLDAQGRPLWSFPGFENSPLSWSADRSVFGPRDATYRSAATGRPAPDVPAVSWTPTSAPNSENIPAGFTLDRNAAAPVLPATAPPWTGPAGAGIRLVHLDEELAGIPAGT